MHCVSEIPVPSRTGHGSIGGYMLGGIAFFLPVSGIEKISWYLVFHGILVSTTF